MKKENNVDTIKSLQIFVDNLQHLEDAVKSFKTVHKYLIEGYKKDKDFDWLESYPSLLNSQTMLEQALLKSNLGNIILKTSKKLELLMKKKNQPIVKKEKVDLEKILNPKKKK